jgi:predicted enzyme related to lactoylglutathione lyase
MSEMTTYAPGIPCWVDLASPDVGASVGFYGALLGWEVPESENAEQTGGYRIATQRGKSAAGMMPLMQEGQPPAWSTYVSVDDADATTEKAKAAGGQVIAEPMDVMDLGRMAVFTDPTGAYIGIWQAGSFAGAELVNEPGTFTYNELNTRDPDAAKAFYGAVFGWGSKDIDMGESGTYTVWRHPDRAEDEDGIGGLLDIRGRVPDEVPPHWLTYFTIEDVDESIEQAMGMGGKLTFGPMDLPNGRLAVLIDPQGAAFGIYQSTE